LLKLALTKKTWKREYKGEENVTSLKPKKKKGSSGTNTMPHKAKGSRS